MWNKMKRIHKLSKRYLGFTSTTCNVDEKIINYRGDEGFGKHVEKPNRACSGNYNTCRAPLGDTMAIFKARESELSIDVAIARVRSSSPALEENVD